MHIPNGGFCVTDGREMMIFQTGALVEVVTSAGPYYKIYCDVYECPECRARIGRPATNPAAMHFQPEYASFANVAHTVHMR